MTPRVAVIADDRESASGVIEALGALENVDVRVRRLSVGDYRVNERLIFERKTLSDFAVSVVDGRLFRQAIRLANAPLKAVLILEGTAADLAAVGVRREALQGALITVSLILGIAVLRARNAAETAQLIVFAARQAQAAAAGGIHRPGYRPRSRGGRQRYILQSFPGIGPQRAARLLARFGSVQAVVGASAEDLAAIEGIGPRIAQRIRSAVGEQVDSYGFGELFML